MDEFMMINLALEALNGLLLIGLLTVYVPNYRTLPSISGMGLIVFSSLLLLQNIVGIFLHFSGQGLYEKMASVQECGLQLIETIALLVLAYSTWKE